LSRFVTHERSTKKDFEKEHNLTIVRFCWDDSRKKVGGKVLRKGITKDGRDVENRKRPGDGSLNEGNCNKSSSKGSCIKSGSRKGGGGKEPLRREQKVSTLSTRRREKKMIRTVWGKERVGKGRNKGGGPPLKRKE